MSWQDNYRVWQQQPTMIPYIKRELDAIADDPKALEAAFSGPMSFGTAGMRGVMGPGIGQMNVYTVRQATEGVARYLDTLDEATKQRGVAISFDSRYHSTEFAHEAAHVLGAHHIPSFVFDDLRPTPELSFAVRHLHTAMGIMITASHNPKQYNGYKIYGPDGGQMPPKASDMITDFVRSAKDVFDIKVADEQQLRADKTMQIIGENVDQPYLQNVESVTINPDLIQSVGKTMKLIYTPLHGTGKVIGERALRGAGFENFTMVPEQAIADPEFPTVPFPNPEFAQAFDMAIALGKKEGADLLVATDPDADRLGAAVREPGGDYQLLTGNQIASILLAYILKARKAAGQLPANSRVVKSIVSTELATKIAAAYGVEMKNVLTGFKFIAEQIHQYETNHDHTFLFGFEESYGYLIKPFVRDKDAIQSTVLLAEVAADYKQRGMTLYDGIQELYATYGYFAEKTTFEEFPGVDGADQMAHLMSEFRENAPKSFGDSAITTVEDFSTSIKTEADGTTSKIDLPQSNVLKYWLDDGTWICIRPSGTEPKVKFYIGTSDQTDEAAQKRLAGYEAALKQYVDSVK
ncbi:phospho-sugar mutase [Levilactobacillus tujiorum]|uniref:phosphoglucomutase (alpha-D-glucose-1,6-bisphosphate-dependent) n=1 Tax=Levilactobacillus tujiorum TaxID=2912243 RepID=A0ABX1L5J0_9LACO|nr:phospho-sugar mutase [Levilactobacillus tujiorum]MCH5464665.1 phospho-sugar mutase [Levilactobacillus tujiorum]NLR11652.1 phospho-sugar mutase [Lactobacillus sp. HBUAS51387]NLR29574.1 phospho-sugar mutase [Levilactobacillus tujiorum]